VSVDILMPALSPTMEEGTLAKWLVKEGDTVKAGDVIAEIETDKATMEVEAVDEGVIEAHPDRRRFGEREGQHPIARLKGRRSRRGRTRGGSGSGGQAGRSRSFVGRARKGPAASRHARASSWPIRKSRPARQ
jgi:hypothetical protein